VSRPVGPSSPADHPARHGTLPASTRHCHLYLDQEGRLDQDGGAAAKVVLDSGVACLASWVPVARHQRGVPLGACSSQVRSPCCTDLCKMNCNQLHY
jgi:hypothetical protein